MSTWVLIFWMSYSGSSVVPGFTSKVNCQEAGKAYQEASDNDQWVCVEQK